ncbi:MAG TPA: MCE family protein [Marmoricola sp.]|nr:MCE family protein [Marmoricola sp.]
MGASLGRSKGPLVGVIMFAAFALLLTAMVAGTLSRGALGSTHAYSALFTDASGLQSGDDVRIAGVRVGRVTDIKLDGKVARVSFDLQADERVYANTTAAIDYLNLMGQRYVNLRLSGTPGPTLSSGTTIPLNRTSVGLDLTAMFNAFRPLFQLIKPSDVNVLAGDIVQVLQGEGGAIQDLVNQTAQMTKTLANRDQVIGAVITNVSAVMQTVSSQRTEVAAIITQLNGLTSTVAQHRDEITSTIDAAQGLVTSVSGLVNALKDPLNADVSSLAAWATSFAKQTPKLAQALSDTQLLLLTYIKTLGLGSYLNTYVCNSLIQLGNAPAQNANVSTMHSERCR